MVQDLREWPTIVCTPCSHTGHGHFNAISIPVEKPTAGVQPRWIQGDSKVGTESASLEKYIFNHRYREIRNG